MKKILLLLIILFTLPATAQEKQMVLIEIERHIPQTPDALSEKTVKRFIHYMESNPISYEESFREITKIVMVTRDREFISELKDGTLYLNTRLNHFPYTKEAAILLQLAKNTGMRTRKCDSPHVSCSRFIMSAYNEEMFRRQFVNHNPYKYIVRELKEVSPLRSRQ